MLEPRTGVFVGQVSAMVRERLWQRVCKDAKDGACMMIHSTNNEQGFLIESWGTTSRMVSDWEGLQLVTIPATQESLPPQATHEPSESPAVK